MNNQDFKAACSVSDLKPGVPFTVELDDRFVVLVKLDNDIYCIDDICTHDGGTLGDGTVDDFSLACPRHGAKFDVRTGEAITMPATEATASHEVKIVDNTVYIKIND
ncbi:MAG: non-heme iron oxygenase ferredoxin subunit [Pirellulaceae bacterium]|nr:non-heme iron oxygenase ferredoxin subunit [Pirellulaceae bacterium]